MYKLVMMALFACSGGMLFGYDTGTMVATLPMLVEEQSLTDEQTEAVVGHTKAGAALGALLGSWLFRHGHGPRWTFFLSNAAYVAGPALMAFASGYLQISFGRLLTGFGIGMSAVTAPVYLGDIAPKESRGAVVAMYELMLAFGVLIASLIAFVLQLPAPAAALSHLLPFAPLWRVLFVLPALPALLLLLCSLLLPDPPSRLVALGHVDRAFNLLLRLHSYHPKGLSPTPTTCCSRQPTAVFARRTSSQTSESVTPELDESRSAAPPGTFASRPARFSSGSTEGSYMGIPLSPSGALLRDQEHALEGAQEALNGIIAGQAAAIARSNPIGLHELVFGKERRAARLLLLAVCNQASGVSTLTVYLGTVLSRTTHMSHTAAGLASCGIVLLKLIAVLFAMCVVDRVGRRSLLIAGSLLNAVALALIAASIASHSALLTIGSIGVYVVCYAASLAPVFYILLAELFSESVRPLAAGVATGVTFATGALTDSVFLSLCGTVGYSGALGTFSGLCLLCALTVLLYLPETKGRTQLEILRLLASDSSMWSRRRGGGMGAGQVRAATDSDVHTELSVSLSASANEDALCEVSSAQGDREDDELRACRQRRSSALVLAA